MTTSKSKSSKKPLSKRQLILRLVILIVVINFSRSFLYETSTDSHHIITINNAPPKNPANRNMFGVPTGISKPEVTYYKTSRDPRYHYEFRFEHNNHPNANDDPRLVILLNGSVRTCVDYWNFAVGRRILAALRAYHFSILVICSKRKTYDPNGPVQNNADVQWIYTYLQTWMNDVYYKQFHHYPRLYMHGISRGSRIAALLCRILPIQQQIFTVSIAHRQGLLTHSDYPIDLQKRLQLDPVFANWFYFDFCYRPTLTKDNLSELCPFQSDRHHYQPVPPTYFIHLQNDRLYNLSDYTSLMHFIREDAFALGGKLLNDVEGVKFYMVPPSDITRTYMQETFDTWHSKPYASVIFYDHFVKRNLYEAYNKTRRTCQCLTTDFRYYQLFPELIRTWTKQKQDEYKDYLNDIKKHIHSFCEDVCGDLYTDHAMSSRHLDEALEWMNRMDALRRSLLLEDYLSRPLRIWMYDKVSVVPNNSFFSANIPDYVDILKQYQMYSPEYSLQVYFQQLKASSHFPRHNLQWADNPLLADYFIIPSDVTYHYFHPDIRRLQKPDYQIRVDKLNTDYFERILANIRTKFPYWTMAKHADQHGSNHILTILAGRNMGIFHDQTREILKNVVQIVFTGIRHDMLGPGVPPPHDYRGVPIIYRHGYDVVTPQFTRILTNNSLSQSIPLLVKNKKVLLFFAGTLQHTMTPYSARPLLSALWNDRRQNHKYNLTAVIAGKQYDTLSVFSGHQRPDEYIHSIQSTVFALCPEGFFWWSPRLYDAIQLGAIPLILADNIALPFERFIDWPSFVTKINVSNIENIITFVTQIDNLEEYMTRRLTFAKQYAEAFRWPFADIHENGHHTHALLLDEDKNGTANNTLHYIALELRCRRLEQFYGLTSDSFSAKSINAQRQACTAHPSVCPCHDPKRSLAFRENL